MAEFMYIMEQVRRICYEHSDCEMCPLYKIHNSSGCAFDYYVSDGVSLDEVEHKIREWAAEHSEQVYPSWNEWYRQNFTDAYCDGKRMCPMTFGDGENCNSESDCDKCRDRPIPAEIAEKLGINPKEAG